MICAEKTCLFTIPMSPGYLLYIGNEQLSSSMGMILIISDYKPTHVPISTVKGHTGFVTTDTSEFSQNILPVVETQMLHSREYIYPAISP